jgi:hypothetical protein
MDSPAFESLCEALERRSSLDRLEARGTVRLALKKAGLDARSVTADQLAVIVEKILPNELDSRGLEGVGSLCEKLAGDVANFEDGPERENDPESVFTRLGDS